MPVLELVRKLFGPVVLGLIVSTVAAVMFMT
ncbi:integral membrane protein [Bordetella pertussis]|nr:integral membrane protein [Bordetella pertussis]